jgi:glycosyltransferase involved in cell wall biosynthesis
VVGTFGIHTDQELKEASGQAMLLVPSGDGNAFNAAVIRLLHDDRERARLGQAGEILFRGRYSWPVIASKVIETMALVNK